MLIKKLSTGVFFTSFCGKERNGFEFVSVKTISRLQELKGTHTVAQIGTGTETICERE